MVKKALIDISVLLIFFTRHEQFAQVFEQVRKARPSRLFLYQDGPRPGREDDIINIKKCREIAGKIDWECEVHKFYQEENQGVDPSGYIADAWAFSQTDKCIVLEDDVVPSLSFFSFCKEMLDQYEKNEKIMLISGFNPEEITKDVDSDYFFSSTTYTWGWASWSRVVLQWDTSYAFLKDVNKRQQVQEYIKENNLVMNMINVFQKHLESGVDHFETLLISNQYLHEGLTIVPKRNMIQNIGLTEDASHFSGDIRLLPKGYRKIFQLNKYEIDLDAIVSPNEMKDFPKYRQRTYRIYGWGYPIVKLYRTIETYFYYIKYGRFRDVCKDIRYKIDKIRTKTFS